jgi:hypothetical protein
MKKREFEVNRAEGLVTHIERGLVFEVYPYPVPPEQAAHLLETGFVQVCWCALPDHVQDRRKPHQMPASGPNAAGVRAWALWAYQDPLQEFFETLVYQERSLVQACAMLTGVASRAADAWLWAATLDRQQPRREPVEAG